MKNNPVGKELKTMFSFRKSMFEFWGLIAKPIFGTAFNLCLLLQKEQNVKGGEGPSGKQAVGINNETR